MSLEARANFARFGLPAVILSASALGCVSSRQNPDVSMEVLPLRVAGEPRIGAALITWIDRPEATRYELFSQENMVVSVGPGAKMVDLPTSLRVENLSAVEERMRGSYVITVVDLGREDNLFKMRVCFPDARGCQESNRVYLPKGAGWRNLLVNSP